MNLYNPFFFIPPKFPTLNDEPPTLYSIMNSIVNDGKEPSEYTKIKDLWQVARETIFDFDYPLTQNVSRETFEHIILNHYMMRRIGFETVTAFRIQLENKLNVIMPKYNILFDSIQNWNLFRDGQTVTRALTDVRSGTKDDTLSQNTILNNTSDTTNKESDLPQGELTNLDDNKYVTKYVKGHDSSNSSGSTASTTGTTTSDTINAIETTTYSQTDLANLYIEFQNNINNIYQLIFNDLDSLFYGLV